jgi:hypothetical protein
LTCLEISCWLIKTMLKRAKDATRMRQSSFRRVLT